MADLLFKTENCGFISFRVGDSKKSGKPYLMVEYKGKYKIDMLYLEYPDKKLVEHFEKMIFGDTFELNVSVKMV